MGGGDLRRSVALCALVALAPGCLLRIGAPPPPPTRGYGDPYAGTGKPIYIKDSRTDWDVSEGDKKITSEQALEATGDEEYEARRQIAKAHNDHLYVEGKKHRSRGNVMIPIGFVLTVAGVVVGGLLPTMFAEETLTPATAMEPEMRDTKAGGTSNTVGAIGVATLAVGLTAMLYGYFGGKRPPPYHRWRTPKALDRPAYIRERTEAYNEKMGAPGLADQPGGFEVPLAPGQRKPPPPRPGMPPMRPGEKAPPRKFGSTPSPAPKFGDSPQPKPAPSTYKPPLNKSFTPAKKKKSKPIKFKKKGR